MGKVKTIYRILVPALVVLGMALSPFPAVADAPTLLGDVNGDGMINSLDITTVERIIVELDAPTAGADVNQNGAINVLDITKIERIIVGLD